MTNQTPESMIAAAMVAAGAPLMHSRVEEAVAAALRAANMLRESGVRDAATDKPDPCDMTHTPPFDFAQCETHDTTFPLGGVCKWHGKNSITEVLQDEADEQRGLKVRAEAERDAALAAIERVRAVADQWNGTPDYQPSEYDKGRVDQRHDMTEQLLAALDGAPEPEAQPSITVDEAALARVVRSALPYDVEVSPVNSSKTERHFRTVADGDFHVERITNAIAEYLTGGTK